VRAASLGLLVRSAGSTVSDRKAELAQAKATLAAIPEPKQAISSADVASASARMTAVGTVAAQRVTWDGLLGAFSRVVPEDVWLLSLTASSTSGAPATADASSAPATGTVPTAFTITGYTYSQPSVSRLMRRLALVPWLSDVSLVTSSRSAIDRRTVYQFTVGANVIPTPEVGS
jgi:Tfp pilus assembly protein PilN